MLKRRIFVLGAIFHFVVIILHNISSTADGYHRIYGKENDSGQNSPTFTLIQKINHLSPILEYACFSGSETGFGFFAPQVGSQYISRFSAFNAEGDLISETIAPHVKRQESLLRYSNFLDLFQDMLHAERTIKQSTRASDSLTIRYSHAIVYSMAERVLAGNKRATKVNATIFLYRYPSLKGYESGKLPRYVPIHQQTVEAMPAL